MQCEQWTLKAGVGQAREKSLVSEEKLVSEGLDLMLELVTWHKHFLREKLFEP